jgi:hypothetical protein
MTGEQARRVPNTILQHYHNNNLLSDITSNSLYTQITDGGSVIFSIHKSAFFLKIFIQNNLLPEELRLQIKMVGQR